MPTYEYSCNTCRKTFEVWQKISDEPLKTCTFEGCGGLVTRSVGGGAGLIFKGSGFYVNDYKKSNPKKNDNTPATPEKTPAATK